MVPHFHRHFCCEFREQVPWLIIRNDSIIHTVDFQTTSHAKQGSVDIDGTLDNLVDKQGVTTRLSKLANLESRCFINVDFCNHFEKETFKRSR
jgi:hypothetical protein